MSIVSVSVNAGSIISVSVIVSVTEISLLDVELSCVTLVKSWVCSVYSWVHKWVCFSNQRTRCHGGDVGITVCGVGVGSSVGIVQLQLPNMARLNERLITLHVVRHECTEGRPNGTYTSRLFNAPLNHDDLTFSTSIWHSMLQYSINHWLIDWFQSQWNILFRVFCMSPSSCMAVSHYYITCIHPFHVSSWLHQSTVKT